MEKKLKYLTSAIFLIVLTSCSFEEDTRLICDCDYVQQDFQITMCYSDSHNLDNNSLVFNESKKKFLWNSIDLTLSPDQFMEFDKDSISYSFNTEYQKTFKNLDRVNLVYTESVQNFDKYIDKTPIWKPIESTFYQCRVVEGI